MTYNSQKALNIFNAALVTPTYYVFFTSSTIVSSAILFRGFKGSPTSIATVVMGFLQICAGVVLLQLSKSAKDIPDAKVFTGDLDQVRTVAEQEQPESEPKADAIRGTAAIIRRISQSRAKWEAAEAKKVYEDKMRDQMEPIGEDEQVEWDGLKRRKTTLRDAGGLHRRKTLHPPLGLTHFPDSDDEAHERPVTGNSGRSGGFQSSFLSSFRRKSSRNTRNVHDANPGSSHAEPEESAEEFAEVSVPPYKASDAPTQFSHHPDGAVEMTHVYGLPPSLQHSGVDSSEDTSYISPNTQRPEPIKWAETVQDRPTSRPSLAPLPPHHATRRQFSFQNVFNRHKRDTSADSTTSHLSRKGLGPRHTSKDLGTSSVKSATEEERLGLVKGDSHTPLPSYRDEDEDEDNAFDHNGKRGPSSGYSAGVPTHHETPSEQWSHLGLAPQLHTIPSAGRLRMDGDNSDDSESEHELGLEKEFEHRPESGASGRGGGAGAAFI